MSISAKIGSASQTLNEWIRKVEADTGQRGGVTTGMTEKMKALEREVRELKPAIHQLRPAREQLVHHSDRGSQYLSIKYTERLAEAGIEPSFGSVGDSYDNALAKTINGQFKAEVIHRRGPWRSFEAVEYAALEWVDGFHNRRLLAPIRNIPPAEAEAKDYTAPERSGMAA